LLAQDPAHADARFLLGMVAAGAGRFREACRLIEEALALVPDRAEYHAQLARCYALLGEQAQAAAAAERALALGPESALTWDTVGVVLARLGEHERAAHGFERAVALAPDNAAYLFNLAAEQQFLGEIDVAEASFERVVQLAPRHYRAHYALASLRRWTPERNHLERLSRLLRSVDERDVDGALLLRHALAKECEDVGRYGEAFAHLTAGKARKRAQLGYSFERDAETFATVERLFPLGRELDPSRGHSSRAPIFVIGMPRTGTTLVERILSSHSDVHSAGELPDFAVCLQRLAQTDSRRVLDPRVLERGSAVDPRLLGESYIASTAPRTRGKPRFVDKSPLNFFYVGFIRAALPNAKIICLRRDPLDACLSNFRQLFALGFSYYDYTYDLRDVGRYYACFDRLMAHWRKLWPDAVLELRYERLVANQEAETRRLLEFCELSWQPECLAFERNPAPVATASATQVRSALNAGSIGRWRLYAPELAPLIAELRAAGIALEYA
jgi:tetratricopeptide (TPR) repeat protein